MRALAGPARIPADHVEPSAAQPVQECARLFHRGSPRDTGTAKIDEQGPDPLFGPAGEVRTTFSVILAPSGRSQSKGTRTRAHSRRVAAFAPVDACRSGRGPVHSRAAAPHQLRSPSQRLLPPTAQVAWHAPGDRIGSAGDAPDTRRRRCGFDGGLATGGVFEPSAPVSLVFRFDGAPQMRFVNQLPVGGMAEARVKGGRTIGATVLVDATAPSRSRSFPAAAELIYALRSCEFLPLDAGCRRPWHAPCQKDLPYYHRCT